MNEKLFFARALAARTSKYFLLLAALALFVTLWVFVGFFAVVALLAFVLAIFMVTNVTAGNYVLTKITGFLSWASAVLHKIAQKIHEKAIEIKDDASANANASYLASVAKKKIAAITKAENDKQTAEKNVTDLELQLQFANAILADTVATVESSKTAADNALLAANDAAVIAAARNSK